jgi:hypothetical protein
MARIVELILSDELVGSGTDGDPYRRALELWTKDGHLVARDDHVGRGLKLKDVKVVQALDLGAIK